MRVSRAVQFLITGAIALAVSGCMHRPAPEAVGPSLDAQAYNDGAAVTREIPPPPMQRGLFNSMSAPAPVMAAPAAPGPDYAAPLAYSPAVGPTEYQLDAGDRLRVVVYGQEGLSNIYAVGANGSITMPLIGAVQARGHTPSSMARAITSRLKDGYIRDPSVAVEIDSYRPFFILGEVLAPGQYPYVPNMTVENAVAIAGGFTPRASQNVVRLTRTNRDGSTIAEVPLGTPLRPGDSVVVQERWF